MTVAAHPRTYLDHNATAPLRPEARAAMLAAFDAVGNPSSVHAEGRRARALVDRARDQVARSVGARPGEVVFTSGATEANAWVMGAGWDVILMASVEHDSVDAPARASGAEIIDVPLLDDGCVDLAALAAELVRHDGRKALLALQLANNETGIIQPVAAAAALAREAGAWVHCDAVQAVGRVAVDFAGLGVDTMSVTGHKLGGPKGTGALLIRDGRVLPALIAGGGQERRRRAGTENVVGIAGFGAAVEAAVRGMTELSARLHDWRCDLERQALALVPEAVVIGSGAPRLANTLCLAWPGQNAETLVIQFDLAGIAVSAGAACSSGKVGVSRVLNALGLRPDVARSAIRLSFGWNTSKADLESFLCVWGDLAAGVGKRRAVA